MFDYIVDADLKWALEHSYNFCIKRGYLPFFSHPAIKLHNEKTIIVDTQNHIVISHIRRPKNIDKKVWKEWIKKNKLKDITLQDVMYGIISDFDKVYKEKYKEVFHTCHSACWVYDNLRQIALYGVEHHQKYREYWDIARYDKLASKK